MLCVEKVFLTFFGERNFFSVKKSCLVKKRLFCENNFIVQTLFCDKFYGENICFSDKKFFSNFFLVKVKKSYSVKKIWSKTIFGENIFL